MQGRDDLLHSLVDSGICGIKNRIAWSGVDDIANLTDVSGDHHPDAIGPQFSRHLVEDLGRRHIDIGDRLRVDNDCVNVGAFRRAADLTRNRLGIGEEQPSILSTAIPSIRRFSGCRSRSEK